MQTSLTNKQSDRKLEVRVITPKGDMSGVSFSAVWQKRALVKALALRSIKSRFRDTNLGILWAFVQPLIYMIVINTFFGLIARFDTGSVPYPLHLLVGIVAYQFISKSLTDAAQAIAGNKTIITRVYVPPAVFPAASLISTIVDIFFPAILVGLFLIYYQVAPTVNMLALPIVLLFLLMLAAAAQLLISILAMIFPDVRAFVPTVAQVLFFATPIFYPAKLIPEQYTLIYGLFNPLAGLLEALRWSVLGIEKFPNADLIWSSAIMTVVWFVVGCLVFRRSGRLLYRYV